MKIFKTVLAVVTAVLLSLALFAAPSSAAPGVKDQSNSGVLTQRDPVTKNPTSSPYEVGEQIQLYANFADGVRNVTFYRETTPNSNTWTEIGQDMSSTSGGAYFTYTVVADDHRIYAEDENDLETEIDPLDVVAAPPPGTAVLNTSTDGGKTFTAKFTDSLPSGTQTKLQVREICTYETNETNPEVGPFDKDVSQKDCKGPWTTRDTGTQNSSGDTTFTLSDPLEVKHTYRAVSGSTNSNEISFAAPLKTTPQTGLSQLHFNSYEGDSVNTRTRWFEGEFIMTGSSKIGACAATPTDQTKPMSKSRLKGRGNYSWSFEKKSFSLNLDKKSSLCGLGTSKKYALIANHYDKSLLRNSLANFIGKTFDNMAWAPQSAPVDLFVNGSYRGSYLLIERISIQGSVTNNYDEPVKDPPSSDRVDIDELKGGGECEGVDTDDDQSVASHPNNQDPCKTGGYIVEWDFRAGDNDSSAPDTFMNIGTRGLLGIKDPEFDYNRENQKTKEGISSIQRSYIDNYVDNCDAKLFSSNFTDDNSNGWESCIDKASAVDYYLAMEYLKPVDGNMWASVYMYKPRGGKLRMGPLWDFDLAVGSASRAGNVVSSSSWYLKNNLGVSAQQSSKTWFNRLNEDPEFRSAVDARWNAVNGELDSTDLETFFDERQADLSSSASANYSKWGYKCNISQYQVCKGSWGSDVSYVKSWAKARTNWINGQL